MMVAGLLNTISPYNQ